MDIELIVEALNSFESGLGDKVRADALDWANGKYILNFHGPIDMIIGFRPWSKTKEGEPFWIKKYSKVAQHFEALN